MKWRGRTGSTRVETRIGGRGVALGGAGIVLVLVYTLLTGDPSMLLNNLTGGSSTNLSEARIKELTDFSSVVLADTETVWNQIFADYGKDYVEPTLVIFTGSVESACGVAGASTGPFYCPEDQKVYLDLEFFEEMSTRFKAPGDFAMAYVIAHEVGHHVQNQLGILEQVNALRQKSSAEAANALSVRLELQADYLAGVWAHYVQGYGYLEAGDVEEALAAAYAIGDDTLQKEAQGYVVPDSFTHGTSDQRQRWLNRGLTYGDLDHGDTFNAESLSALFPNIN